MFHDASDSTSASNSGFFLVSLFFASATASFSELVSNKPNISKIDKVSDARVPREKKSFNKILIYSSLLIIIAIIKHIVENKIVLLIKFDLHKKS